MQLIEFNYGSMTINQDILLSGRVLFIISVVHQITQRRPSGGGGAGVVLHLDLASFSPHSFFADFYNYEKSLLMGGGGVIMETHMAPSSFCCFKTTFVTLRQMGQHRSSIVEPFPESSTG